MSRLPRQTLATALTDALRERILVGDWTDGEQLRQDALSQEYGVSRIPVREALRQLEAEGLVQIHAHRGAVVSRLSIDDVLELLEVRALLEGDLLRRAIPLLSEADLDHAERVLERYEAALAAQDIRYWGELNADFHLALFGPLRRPNTLAIIENIHHKTDRYIRMQLLLARFTERAHREHRELLALCRQREVDTAAAFLAEHILAAGHALRDYLSQPREAEAAPR